MEAVVFSVTIKYQNLDLRDWNADKIHHEALFKASLTATVAGLHEDDIVDISGSDKSTRRLTAGDDTATEVPAECEACATCLQANNGDSSPYTHEKRVLIIKRLELYATFNIRPQYFSTDDVMTVADVYDTVTSSVVSSSNEILVGMQSNSTYFSNAVVLSTTYSTYSSVIIRSSQPTSTPTSSPTCGLGSFQVGSGCGPCAEGYYTDELNAFQCTACPVNTYSNVVGSAQCSLCGDFTTNIYEASTTCPHFSLHASAFTYYSLGSFVTALFLSALLFAGENVYIMFVLGLFPFLDIVSDMIYILSIKFWSFELFACAIIFFVVPSSMFIYKLIKMRACPRLMQFVGVDIMNGKYIWLSVSPEGSPLINGKRSSLSYEEHDGIEKLAWFWVLWALLVAFQLLFLVVCLVWYAFASVFLVAWLFVGLFLYQTKMLAIDKVWNTWFYTWSQSDYYHKEISLDASVLNESLFHEFILETIPQITIQSINNSLIYNGDIPAISLFSLAMSIFIAINGIYRYGYYLLWKGTKFDEIPLPLAVRMQKINKGFLPRRSMISRKWLSLVKSVKISDESSILAMKSPSDDALADTMYYMEIVINKLQAVQRVAHSNKFSHENRHKFQELLAILKNVVSDSPDFDDDIASDDDDDDGVSSDPAVAIDIDSMIRRAMSMRSSSKVVPTEVTMSDYAGEGKKGVVLVERRRNTSEMKGNDEDFDAFDDDEVEIRGAEEVAVEAHHHRIQNNSAAGNAVDDALNVDNFYYFSDDEEEIRDADEVVETPQPPNNVVNLDDDLTLDLSDESGDSFDLKSNGDSACSI